MRFRVIFSPAVIVSEGVWLSESIVKMLGFEADAQFVIEALTPPKIARKSGRSIV